MLRNGATVDAGRIGAEIAYTVCTRELGLKDVVLVDPTRVGPDLFSKDGKVVVQARMLTATEEWDSVTVKREVQTQLKDLVRQLARDFRRTPNPTTGYAVLTYVDNDHMIKTVVFEVPS